MDCAVETFHETSLRWVELSNYVLKWLCKKNVVGLLASCRQPYYECYFAKVSSLMIRGHSPYFSMMKRT